MREHQRSRSKEPAGSDWGFGRLHGPPPPLLTTTQILSKVQLASILPLKSPTSFHTSSQKSNQLPHFLSKVQPASILPLKVQPHLPSPPTFHTSSQMSNQPPYFLSKIKPPSILPLKVQPHLPYFLSKVHQPSMLPFKSPTTFHTSSQMSNKPPYFLSKVKPPSILPLKSSTSPFWHVGRYFFYKNGRSWKINPKVPNQLSCWLKKGHWRNPIAKTDIRAEIRIFGPTKNTHFLIQTMF